MIARSWRGWTRAQDAGAFREYVTRTWIRDCHAARGNRGAYLFSRIVGDRAEVITLSLWESEEALTEFFRGDVDAPHYYPQDERYVIEGDDRVIHYEAGGSHSPPV